MPADEMRVVVAVAGRRIGEGKRKSPSRVTENRFHHHATSVVGVGDDLVTRNERKGNPILEVGGCMTVDEGEVASADPGEARTKSMPPGGRRQRWRVGSDQIEGSEPSRTRRADGADETSHGELGWTARNS
jgi:hypothetical protein